MWTNRPRCEYNDGPYHKEHDFREYLWWLHGVSRLRLRPSLDQVPIGEGDSEDEGDPDDYDEQTRLGVHPERGPRQDYVVCSTSVVNSTHTCTKHCIIFVGTMTIPQGEQIAWLANEAGVALRRAGGRQDGPFIAFARVNTDARPYVRTFD